MPDRDGIDDWVQKDRETVQQAVSNARSGDGYAPDPGALLEQVLWTGAILSALFMMVSMPWVGPDEPIPGTAWLGLSLAGIIIPGILALLVRFLRRGGFEQVDSAVDSAMEK